MRYIAIVAFAAAVLWMIQGDIQPRESVAATAPAPEQIVDMGRIVVVGHRERM